MYLCISVRTKAKDLVEFIQDDERLREERKKAKKNRDKYIGMSGDSYSTNRYSMIAFFVRQLK
jgi:epsin